MRPTQARALARRPEIAGRVSVEGGSLVVKGRRRRSFVDMLRIKTRQRIASLAITLSPLRG